jgi:hypothetical protein
MHCRRFDIVMMEEIGADDNGKDERCQVSEDQSETK